MDELINEREINRALKETIQTLELEAHERNQTSSLFDEGVNGNDTRCGIRLSLDKDFALSEVCDDESDTETVDQSHEATPQDKLVAASASTPPPSTSSIWSILLLLYFFMMGLIWVFIFIYGLHIPIPFYVKVEYDSPPPT